MNKQEQDELFNIKCDQDYAMNYFQQAVLSKANNLILEKEESERKNKAYTKAVDSQCKTEDVYTDNGKIKIYIGPITEAKLYEKALIIWGGHKQIRKFIQECNEAAAAISQYYEDGKLSLDDVASELADVEIMLAQMKNIVNTEASENLVENYRQVKLLRLENRLKEVV